MAILLSSLTNLVWGQRLSGKVVDAKTGEGIPMAKLQYNGSRDAVVTDINGNFTILRRNGATLTASSIGYSSQQQRIKSSTQKLQFRLKEDVHEMKEFTVTAKKERYSRKENPAVELMRRVVAARQKTQLENHDFLQYNKYQKISLALNDYKLKQEDSTATNRFQWNQQTEISPLNGKVIMPISVDETVTQHVYRKEPRTDKDIVLGIQSSGLGQLMQMGEMVNTAMKEVFQDVDITEDYVRLLQYHFPSPIGNAAVGFYRFFIVDTVAVDVDSCYHLRFHPNNLQDFGFTGELWILADSTLHVKRCSLSLPKQSDVNFVDQLHIEQEFTRLDSGDWALTRDDMWAEMRITKLQLLAVRNTRLSDYSFEAVPRTLLRGKAQTRYVANARQREDKFWEQYRAVELSDRESSVGDFMDRLRQHKAARVPLFVVKLLAENYIETGSAKRPSKFDFGPVLSSVSHNYVDGLRLRLSGRTTGALSPHWFAKGYYAHGLKSDGNYYGASITYSFNRKQHSSFEFPQRSITVESSRDMISSSDRFLYNDKDNIFAGIRTENTHKMFLYNRQRITFTYETDYGLSWKAALKAESNKPRGDLRFTRLASGTEKSELRTTELSAEMNFSPGQTYINTKQRRYPINFDSPELNLKHTVGFRGFLGGEYWSNLTEFSAYKRQWLGSWGYIDMHLKGAAQWNRVPFPLLLTPPINLSYIEQEGTMNMLHDMEFLMDRRLTWIVSWDMNGKLFNRIPLLKKLKWREYFAIKGTWGYLSSHNNPYLDSNQQCDRLFSFPDGVYIIEPSRPYLESVVGIHNILKLFSVEWVRRLTYTDHPGTHRNGVRFGLQVSF